MATAPVPKEQLQCDYLVVGAGISGLSFVDSMMKFQPTASVIVVDRMGQAGGHWTVAYDFATLHAHSSW